ncbi:hypothetical protein H9P43_006813 [Blastocladiella emersonii ATCC 22665]|nr:hypothetical protein H9P43_006813 [Blastocladiella emersonii ATCC 22665]
MPGRADDLEGQWAIKQAFAERVINFVEPRPQYPHEIIWRPSGTVKHMIEALRDAVFANNTLTREYGLPVQGKVGCWFCTGFVDLCPPSSRVHPRNSCPLIVHPYALSEALVAAMRAADIDWRQYQREAPNGILK